MLYQISAYLLKLVILSDGDFVSSIIFTATEMTHSCKVLNYPIW